MCDQLLVWASTGSYKHFMMQFYNYSSKNKQPSIRCYFTNSGELLEINESEQEEKVGEEDKKDPQYEQKA